MTILNGSYLLFLTIDYFVHLLKHFRRRFLFEFDLRLRFDLNVKNCMLPLKVKTFKLSCNFKLSCEYIIGKFYLLKSTYFSVHALNQRNGESQFD